MTFNDESNQTHLKLNEESTVLHSLSTQLLQIVIDNHKLLQIAVIAATATNGDGSSHQQGNVEGNLLIV